MKNKFIFFIILLTLFLSISTISASENITDVHGADEDMDICSLDNATAEVNRSATDIRADDVVSYIDLNDNFTVSLTSNGSALANKTVRLSLDEKLYNKTTDDFGIAVFDFKLKNGTYAVSYSFAGDDEYLPSNGTATILVKPDIITYLKVVDKNINYREGLKSIFQLRLVDVNNNPISNQIVVIIVNGKTYNLTTDGEGVVSIKLKLKKGTYDINYTFNKTGNYLSSNGTFNITVKTKLDSGNGYWVNKWDMEKVNLKKLSKLGTKQIFLQHTAFSKYGEAKVLKWIKKAHKYGIKVHIWLAVFYKDGKYIHAASKKGNYNKKQMNSIIKKAKYYASLDGVDGIHFDYLRYGGNAYKFKNGTEAINYFVKKACTKVRAVNSECIMSAAVMPEPNDMIKYYGQDIPTLSKYLDVVIPMVYKGNYHASSKWIKKTTKTFTKQSNGALIWSGLQTYKSDWNVKKLSYKALFKDAQYAMKGKASGVVLFRWGLSQFLNFNKL